MAIHKLSVTELAQAIRTRRLSSQEAIAACFEQIARLYPQLKAFITLAPESGRKVAPHWFRGNSYFRIGWDRVKTALK